MSFRTFCSLVLSAVLLLPPPGWGQQASGPKANIVAPESGGLKIVVLKGEGAVNSIKARTATPPAVEVRDDQDKPVSGAEVVFHLPAGGPGAVFNGWMRTQTARTGPEGQAEAQGMTPNDQPGRFNIKVTASQGKRTGSVIVAQSNAVGANGAQAGKSRKALWVVLGLAAAGAVGGGIAATRNGNDKSTPTTVPITISPGTVTVAGPR